MQLDKARKRFLSLSKLFYNKYLSSRAKCICYCLLVRPLLTYASPLWYNQSASAMEKTRVFERACLRACTRQYRSADSNFHKFVNNFKLYNTAIIPRIDNFLLKINRDYFANLPKITDNPLITNLATIDTDYYIKCKNSGYLPPEAFTLLDDQGLIQNGHNIPIIYHWSRNNANKKMPANINTIPQLKYSTAIPDCDTRDKQRLNFKKYWWLNESSVHIAEVRLRTRKK